MPDDAHDSTGQQAQQLVDMQAAPDDREIALDRVGVCGLKTPIVVLDRDNERQSTVAEVTLSVFVPDHF